MPKQAEASPGIGNRFAWAGPNVEIRLSQCHKQRESKTRNASTQNRVAKVRITSAGGLSRAGRAGEKGDLPGGN